MLLTKSDFDSAVTYCLDIEVTQDGTVIVSGQILSHTLETVKIGNVHYVKDACEFRVITVLH